MGWASRHTAQGAVARRSVLCCAAAAFAGEGLTVGIDLGTTNSAIAILRDGKPFVVPNAEGSLTTRSVVAYTAAGDALVGSKALEQATANVPNTVHSAKRFIGRSLRSLDPDIVAAAGVAVHAAEDGSALFACPALPEPATAEEVSAQVLLALLDDAERHTGRRAQRAVITVPAYFDDRQRVATRTAATLAGLTQVDLLAEPVAACLAHQLTGAKGTFLVFDLGAGTYDVSVLRLSDSGSVEVVATSGDARLGGNDFDAVLFSWLEKEARSLGCCDSPSARRHLRAAAEAAKQRLSVVTRVEVPLVETNPNPNPNPDPTPNPGSSRPPSSAIACGHAPS